MDLKTGQQVIFGVEYGAKTKGTIMKINRVRCKIRQDEVRNSRPVGTIWSVPFELITTLDGKFVDQNGNLSDSNPHTTFTPVNKSPSEMPSDWWIKSHTNELRILMGIYNRLSPENLCCDGEASLTHIRKTKADCERKLKACFILMGREIDEDICFKCIESLAEKNGKSIAQFCMGV